MSQDVKPTRTELMRVKTQIKLAKQGHGLLKKKRDGLILEFFEILKKARSLRNEMVAAYVAADAKLNLARAIEGDLAVRSIAKAVSKSPQVAVQHKNIVGVVVPRIQSGTLKRGLAERGFGVYGPASIDEAAEAYEKLGELILQVAEIETSIRKLLTEIEKTKRKVNALEFSVMPRLAREKDVISLRLQEMERDNFVRLKLIKSRIEN